MNDTLLTNHRTAPFA